MQTSANGFNLIEGFEGLCLQAYQDIVGVETIGYGHRILPTESFPNGITQAQAYTILESDVSKVEAALNGLNLALNQNQFDALIDFGFNLGVGSLKTMLSHGLAQVPTQILRWDHAGTQVVPGLLRRRQQELVLWNTPVAS